MSMYQTAVDVLETFGYCINNRLNTEPTLLDSYKIIKLKKRGDNDSSESDAGEDSSNKRRFEQKLCANQAGQLKLFKDTYCRMVMSSCIGISETKADYICSQYSCPRKLYDHIVSLFQRKVFCLPRQRYLFR